jgi:hypothetical protein
MRALVGWVVENPPRRHRQFTAGEIRHWQNATADEGVRVGMMLIAEALRWDPDALRRAEKWKRRRARTW